MVRFLLDTNTCIDFIKGRKEVITWASKLPRSSISLSAIVLYELEMGPLKCPTKYQAQQRAILDRFLGLFPLVSSFTRDHAKLAAAIRADLEKEGLMIGPSDVLIAAQALAENLTLVTTNVSEFGRIPSLKIENWKE
jgi:tRNA(fMet)-specific endonuclease VapC